MTLEEANNTYKPLTTSTRVEDFEIPKFISLGGNLVPLPKSITRKDVHYLVSEQNRIVRAAWISKPLAHILNSKRFEGDIKIAELERAVAAIDEEISSLIKNGVLKDKHGPGAMSFSQAHENVPKDSILISERTFNALCAYDSRWEKTKTVLTVRFPNLGPSTTKELKLIVNKSEGLDIMMDSLPPTALAFRISNMDSLFSLFDEEKPYTNDGFLDSFYLHPDTLKNDFQGDGRQTCR